MEQFSQRSNVKLPVLLQGLMLQQQNPFNATTNPTGIINGGVAENTLALKYLVPHFNTIEIQENHFKYGELQGTSELRDLIADLFNRHLDTQLKGNQLSLHNGCGSTIENLIFNMCDEGDEILIPKPFYGGFEMDVQFRMHAKVVAVKTLDFRITLALLEETIQTCKSPKALILCNPDNPTGLCRTKDEMLIAIQFCKKYNIHLISDEIYALTAYNSFQSIFHPDYLSLIDLKKTHLVWSFSKDFCMNGIRVGVYASYNKSYVLQMQNTCYFSSISRFADVLLQQFLAKPKQVDLFLKNNKESCLNMLNKMIDFCKLYDISYIEPNGGFFLYINLL